MALTLPRPRLRLLAAPPVLGPPDPSRVAALDGLRGLAATMVLVYHCWVLGGFAHLDDGWGRAVLGSGYFGVDLFFVISGFVLFLPVAARRGEFGAVKPYAWRRLGRIGPAYYLSLLAVIALNPLLTEKSSALPWESWSGLGSLVAHTLFLQEPVHGLTAQNGFGANMVVWTLSLEAAFYVLLPLVAGAFCRRPLRWVIGAIIVANAWKFLVITSIEDDERLVSMAAQLPSYLPHFAFGMGAALLAVSYAGRWTRRARRLAATATVSAFAVALVLMYRAGERGLTGVDSPADHHFRNTTIAFCFTVMIFSATLRPGRLLTSPAARRLGDISYGVYLFHLPVIGFLMVTAGIDGNGTDATFWVLIALTVPLTILLASWSYRFVEAPVRARIRAWAGEGSDRSAVVAQLTGRRHRRAR